MIHFMFKKQNRIIEREQYIRLLQAHSCLWDCISDELTFITIQPNSSVTPPHNLCSLKYEIGR